MVRAGSLRAPTAQRSSMRRQISNMSVKGRNVIATLDVEQARAHEVVVMVVAVRAGSPRARIAQRSSMRRQISNMSVQGRNVIATLDVEQARLREGSVATGVTAG